LKKHTNRTHNQTVKILDSICTYLNKYNLELSEIHSDGRVNSILNEGELKDIIKKTFTILDPQERAWADIFLANGAPVNIKVTTTNGADNASSKKGVYYALTGKLYTGNESWSIYLESLDKNLMDTDKDYYFLVVNKTTGVVFWNSIKGLSSLTPNGSNPPFQVVWKNNNQFVKKTFEDTRKLVMGTLLETLHKRAQPFETAKHLESFSNLSTTYKFIQTTASAEALF
jgi:hypothetical protein